MELAPLVANTWPLRSDVGLEVPFLTIAALAVLAAGSIGFVASPPIELSTELRNYIDRLVRKFATEEYLHMTHTHDDNSVAIHRL